jgi:hypothetical protein
MITELILFKVIFLPVAIAATPAFLWVSFRSAAARAQTAAEWRDSPITSLLAALAVLSFSIAIPALAFDWKRRQYAIFVFLGIGVLFMFIPWPRAKKRTH